MSVDAFSLLGPLRPYVSALYRKSFPKLYVRHLAKFYIRFEREMLLLPLLIKPDEIGVDVGAHAGAYLWHLLKITDHVVAFEPNPEFASLLRAAFGNRISLHEVALSDATGRARLEIPRDSTGTHQNAPEARLVDKSATSHAGPLLDVAVTKLDSFNLTKVGFMKIDVEGHELSVLRGATDILVEQKPRLLVEAENRHREDAVETVNTFLSDFGYRGFYLLRDVMHPICSFRPEMQDLLTLRSKDNGANTEYVNNFIFIPVAEAPAFFAASANLFADLEETRAL
jgi:FkbM family methyltransferase